jgi:hypothetical protein
MLNRLQFARAPMSLQIAHHLVSLPRIDSDTALAVQRVRRAHSRVLWVGRVTSSVTLIQERQLTLV